MYGCWARIFSLRDYQSNIRSAHIPYILHIGKPNKLGIEVAELSQTIKFAMMQLS